MKVNYVMNDGTPSYFMVRVRKFKYGYKPVLQTPEGMNFTLYKDAQSGFVCPKACMQDTIEVIKQHKDNTIC